MGQKTNVRSFRYSDEVAGALEAFPGGSLNEKFENLVLTYFWNREQIKEECKELGKQYDFYYSEIEQKKGELFYLANLLEQRDKLMFALEELVYKVEEYQRDLEKTLQHKAEAAEAPQLDKGVQGR